MDIRPEAVLAARERFAQLGYARRVGFICAAAESLPFATDTYDVVICRLALPYTNNRTALSEIARVLCPEGLLVLRIHHARYYLRQFRLALVGRRLRPILHATKVLLASTLYHLSGVQPNNRILGHEVFQSRWTLRRVLESVGLALSRELPSASPNPCTPCFLVMKSATECEYASFTPPKALEQEDSDRPEPRRARVPEVVGEQ
jgi:SAM-dependent methyltransferase